MRKLMLLLAVAALSGCALTTPYEEPKAPCNSFKARPAANTGDCIEQPLPGAEGGQWL